MEYLQCIFLERYFSSKANHILPLRELVFFLQVYSRVRNIVYTRYSTTATSQHGTQTWVWTSAPKTTVPSMKMICLCTKAKRCTFPETLIEKKKFTLADFCTLGVHFQSNGRQVSCKTSIEINGMCRAESLSTAWQTYSSMLQLP